jgi:hypothetical protein
MKVFEAGLAAAAEHLRESRNLKASRAEAALLKSNALSNNRLTRTGRKRNGDFLRHLTMNASFRVVLSP